MYLLHAGWLFGGMSTGRAGLVVYMQIAERLGHIQDFIGKDMTI